MTSELNLDSITFGKYKNGTLQQVLKDRSYCDWVLKQEWFQTNYEYLYNRIQEYEPLSYFLLKQPEDCDDFLVNYRFFNLVPVEQLPNNFTDDEKKCYSYYLKMISELKEKIQFRLDKYGSSGNQYDIKAPCRWLKRFEKETVLKRTVFKDFISSYELPNIPYIVERIKKEGGIVYKGAKSFLIAKKKSEEQEQYWGRILKQHYGEDLCTQYKYKNCVFDFIYITGNTIFECKLGLKDFNLSQYKKYKLALEKYRIIYLIGRDGVINIEKRVIYTSDVNKYMIYQFGILSSKHNSKFDEVIKNFEIIHVEDLSTLFVVPK